MPTETLHLSDGVYNLLEMYKHEDETFSEVIARLLEDEQLADFCETDYDPDEAADLVEMFNRQYGSVTPDTADDSQQAHA
jgi:predicted CopG family antitoxin